MKLTENILDPISKELSKEIWENNKLKKTYKVYLLKTFETWLKQYTNKPIRKALFVGSMTGLQYSATSDVDVNMEVDLSDETINKLWDLLPNGNNLIGTDHPVNFYLVNKTPKELAGGIYDIIEDKWIRKSVADKSNDVYSNFKAVTEIARFFISGLENTLLEFDLDKRAYRTYKAYYENAKEVDKKQLNEMLKFKINEILADIDSIYIAKHIIKSLREEAFTKDAKMLELNTTIKVTNANSTINNLIYKYIEQLGYFNKIQEVMDEREEWLDKAKEL